MSIYKIDPLRDPRWGEFLEQHPGASVFHSAQWLRTLHRTYGYEPLVLTSSPPAQGLKNGVVFCRVHSWATGRRMVSLPFSDHCQPLVDNSNDLSDLLSGLADESGRERCKYVEIRPVSADLDRLGWGKRQAFMLHKIDLRPTLNELFRGFERGTQEKIRRVERKSLTYEEGRNSSLLKKFHRLLLLTRRRHQLPPQPLIWFQNLINSLGEKVCIRVVSKDGQPIASILTLCYKRSLVSKYGCSDSKFHNLGGIGFLLWQAMQEAKSKGVEELDLGRSDWDNSGLIAFKDHLGAARSVLTYFRLPALRSQVTPDDWKVRIAKRLFEHMPNAPLAITGRLLYKHMG
jgi:hypothetical protein